MEGNQKLEIRESSPASETARDFGRQPLDVLMTAQNLSNTQIVQTVPELHLTHKMIAKGRRGRRLSRKVQRKVVQAVNAAVVSRLGDDEPRSYGMEDLFTYDGR